MLENEFVPYEQALELKELGFDEPCFGYFDNMIIKGWLFDTNIKTETLLFAPTFSQAFRWFRQRYQLSGLNEIGTQEYSFIVFDEVKDSRKITPSMNGKYEEAELACLKKLIEIVKNK
jgi:hypothetical protein